MKYIKVHKIFIGLLLGAFIFQLTACDDKQQPEPDDAGKPPVERDSLSIPELPTDTTGRDNVPGPNKPVELYRRLKMQWAPTDYRETFYDAKGLPVRMVAENLYIQGSDLTRKLSYEFFYNEQGKLHKLLLDNGLYVIYSYDGNNVKELKEYAKDNLHLTTSTYHYAGDKLVRASHVNHYKKVETQFQFFYDNRGNLTEKREYPKNKTTGEFDVYSATRYTKFDDKRNVDNLWESYPFVPGLIFWNNNYTSTSTYFYDGKTETRISGPKTITYEYLDNGYPASRKERSGSGSLSTTFEYTNF